MHTKTPDVASRIQEAMQEADRSVSWTATKAGISISTFRRKLNRGTAFTVGEVAQVARALDIDPVGLFEGIRHEDAA